MSSVSMPMPLVSGFTSFDEAPPIRVSRPAAPPVAPASPVQRESVEIDALVAAPAGTSLFVPAPAGAGLFVPALAGAGLLQSPSWSPASSGRVRAVEGAVLAALCGWFLYGGLAVLGWV